MNSKLNYRPDIDGLRAVAVLAVVFYHAGVGGFAGGYVGVDVFFVISGYLITSVIFREIEIGDFSLVKFYERRIRRIYPALYIVTLSVLFMSALMYYSPNFLAVGKSAMAATLFMSNMLFWSEAGYFDAPSIIKPMLHTWSLAVEEQFYIVFPLLVLAIMRFAKTRLKTILTALTLVSFLGSVYYVGHDSTAAFYFTHLRAWELMLGSLLAVGVWPLCRNSTFRNILSLVGMAMILSSVFLYSSNTPFPGAGALLPTAGAAMVIYSGIEGVSVVGRMLQSPPLVFIGKISYSLYLWHWVIIVFGKYYLIREATAADMLVWLIVSFILAAFSWKFIENPFRRIEFLRHPKIFKFAAGIMTLTLTLGALIYFNDGYSARFSFDFSLAYQPEFSAFENKCVANSVPLRGGTTICRIGSDANEANFIAWGDSHSRLMGFVMDTTAQKRGMKGYLASMSSCPPLLGIYVDHPVASGCVERNNDVILYIQEHPQLKTVILSARWSAYEKGRPYKDEIWPMAQELSLIDVNSNSRKLSNKAAFEIGLYRTVKKIRDLNREVVIVLPVPEIGYDVPSAFSVAYLTNRDVNEIIAPDIQEYDARNQDFIAFSRVLVGELGVHIVNPASVLCNLDTCPVVVSEQPLYGDSHHLSAFGSQYISSLFNPIFDVSAR